MPIVRAEGAGIYYEVHGDAARPAVVLAHGMGGNAASWWQQVPALTLNYRVLAFDHRGFARSPCDTPADFDRKRFVADLRAILDHAGIKRTAIVCQSMGGQTGLGFALAHPERVTALVLCATVGGLQDDFIARRFKEIRPQGMTLGDVTANALAPDFVKRQPQLAFLYANIKAFNAAIDYSQPAVDQSSVRVDPSRLKGFAVPTLIAAGEKDALVPTDVMRRLAMLIPGAEFRLFAGSGHSPYCEDAETFNAVLGTFLARHLPEKA